jgi:spore coat polysaccharide biosynthesis protein SpsF (cytidylyltransferase family)
MINLAVVLCTRLKSNRIKEKCFYKFEDKPMIEHLLNRLKNFSVFVACPTEDLGRYAYLTDDYQNIKLYAGSNDPLKRMADVVKKYDIKHVIRICHDKIFVDEKLINLALDQYFIKDCDYLYSNQFTEGSGFEIFSGAKVIEASEKFKDCEYISYAVRELTDKIINFEVPEAYKSSYRLLVDYPEDLAFMHQMKMGFSLLEALDFIYQNEKLIKINKLPKLTIYTCNFNGRKYLAECIRSVMRQRSFGEMEYIIIDDCSDDDSLEIINKTTSTFKNIRVIKNKVNIGLAASSNIALEQAKGQYVIRLDADDYFQYQDAAITLYNYITKKGYDAVYCGNQLQKPDINHHIGGAIFNRKEMNFIKFSEKLRGYEGYDFFLRAKNRIKIGYFYKPLWFYRQHPQSMSKTNLVEREILKKEIEANAANN